MSKRSVPTSTPAGIVAAPRRRMSKSWGLVPFAAVAVVALAACNNSDAGGSAQTAAAQAPAGGNSGQITEGSAPAGAGQGNAAGPGGVGQRRPGASGLIAEVDEGSMQVQSRDSQTTVTWTGKTTFAQNVKGSLSDVTEGSCIVAVAPTSAGSGSSGSSAAPSASPDAGAPVTAGTVAITAAVDGRCTGGFGGFGGGNRPNGGAMPSGVLPTGATGARPSGAPGQNGGTGPGNGTGNGRGGFDFGRIVTGKVTSVSGSTITVESTTFAGGAPGAGGQSTAAPSAAPSSEKSTRTVEVTSSTSYTKDKTATSSAVKIGLCATALGTADDTGAIAATSITLSTAVDGSCTSGFGGFGGRGGAGNGQLAPTSVSTHG